MYILFYRGGIIVSDSASTAVQLSERLGYSVASGEAAAIGLTFTNGAINTYDEFSKLSDTRTIIFDIQSLPDGGVGAAAKLARDATSIAIGTIAAEVVIAGMATTSVAVFAPAIALALGVGASVYAEDFWRALNDLSSSVDDEAGENLFNSLANEFLNFFLPYGLSPESRGLKSNYYFTSETIDQSRRLFQDAQFTSPLILDLDGNGVVATTGLGSGTFFDHDGNGLAESTGWVGSGDALLVRDLNGNGRIDDGNELFGNQTDLVNGFNAANGFAALATLDANGDGQVNAQDGSGWSSLRLWRDLNGNGLSEAGELLSLQDAGISSLGTAYSGNANPTDAQGNQHRQLGSFTRTDGSTGAMNDVWFAADPVNQRDANPIEVSETIAALPDMQGLGNVRSLRQAMALDATGQLQTLVQAFVAGDGSGGPGTLAQAEAVLQAWTGCSAVSGMRGVADAKRVAVLEALLADTYYNTNWNSSAVPAAIALGQINQAYEAFVNDLYDSLMGQTHFRALFDSVGLQFDETSAALSLDVSAVVAQLASQYPLNATGTDRLMAEWGKYLMRQGDLGRQVFDGLVALGDAQGSGFALALSHMGFQHLSGGAGDDALTAQAAVASVLMGGDGNDALTGSTSADVLEGGDGDDVLTGGNGNDLLKGGAGNDVLRGGQGDDTYVYQRGDGADVIIDFEAPVASYDHSLGGTDVLRLGGGITAEGTQAFRSLEDLVLVFGEGDSVRVVGHFLDGLYGGTAGRLERVEFGDGTVWDDWSQVEERIIGPVSLSGSGALQGGDDNDTLTATGLGTHLIGGAGDDILTTRHSTGSDYDHIYEGGFGNDTLIGGYARDNYLFNRGDGQDNISDDLRFYPNAAAPNYFAANPDAVDYQDRIRFGAGITIDQLWFRQDGSALEVSIVGTNDKVKINGWYDSMFNEIEEFELANGQMLLNEHVNSLVQAMAAFSPPEAGQTTLPAELQTVLDTAITAAWSQPKGVTLSGSGTRHGGDFNDTLTATGLGTRLVGGAGDDILTTRHSTGSDYDHIFEGGLGNDTLEGGYARDTYLFNRGDGNDDVSDDVRFYLGAAAPNYFAANPDAVDYQDRIKFGEGIATDQLWFRQMGNNLEVSIIGTEDKITVNGWYDSFFNEIEEFELADGQMLLNENVNSLVQAMAAFSPPAAGQTSLSGAQSASLSPVIAANWH